ncbi:hypothetical protein HDZ31DRAFT_64161 [Schizophyllum fasciatum]
MFNKLYVLLPALLAALTSVAAQSYYASAEKYGTITFRSCGCKDVGTEGTAAYAEDLKAELGQDLCCKKVSVKHEQTEVQTTFTDICASCEGHDIGLNGELFKKINGGSGDETPVSVFWSVL